MMSSKSASLPKSHLDDTEGRSQTLVVFHGSEHSFCSHLLGDLMRTNLTLNLDLWFEENLENREKCPPRFFNETKLNVLALLKVHHLLQFNHGLALCMELVSSLLMNRVSSVREQRGAPRQHDWTWPEQTELASSQKWIPLLRSVCSHRLEKRNMPPLWDSHLISPLQGAFVDRFFMCHLVEVTVWRMGLVSAVKENRGWLSSNLCLTWDDFARGHSDWTHLWLLSADTITCRHGSQVSLCSFYSWCVSAGRTTVDWFLTVWNLWWFRSLSKKTC